MSKRKFGIGLVVGAVAGLVAGLLTAPKSGKETRQDIKRKATDVSREAGKQVELAKQKAGDVAEQTSCRTVKRRRATSSPCGCRPERNPTSTCSMTMSAKRLAELAMLPSRLKRQLTG